MEASLGILIESVVTGANPIAVIVDERILDGEEAQGSVDVEERCERRLQFAGWSLIEDPGELDQILPGLLAVLALEVVNLFVGSGLVPQVGESAATIGAARHLPPVSLSGSEELLGEVFVELLGAGVDAPVLTIDHHPHEVGLRGRQVFSGDVAVKHRPQEGRIFVGIEQVEGLVTADCLILVGEIQRHIERALLALPHREEGGHAPEVHAHFAVGLPIDGEGGRHLHIGVVEVSQFLLPIGTFELEEHGPQDALLVPRRVGKTFNLSRRQRLTGSGLGGGLAASRTSWWASTSARAPGSTTADSSSGLFFDEEFAGRLAFLSIEAFVAVLVEASYQQRLGGRSRTARTAGTSSARSTGSARSAGRWPTEAGRWPRGAIDVVLREGRRCEDQSP